MIRPPSLLVGAGTVLALLVGAEMAIRFDDWSRYGTPLSSSVTDISDLKIRDQDGVHARANASFRHFRIDSLGYRGPDRSRAMLDTSLRVVTAGASETFGLYEPENGEWPRRLEFHLAARRSGRAAPVVLNAAFAGMSMPTVAQDIRQRVSRMRPDVVIYYPTPTQYLDPTLPLAAEPDSTVEGPPGPQVTLRARQRFRDATKRLIPEAILDAMRRQQTQQTRETRRLAGAVARLDFPAVFENRLRHFEGDLRRLIGDIRQIGARPVLVLHAHRFRDTTSVVQQRHLHAWAKFSPLVSGGELLIFDSLAAERTRLVGRDSGVAVVDPIPALRQAGESAFADHTHFTAQGADSVAKAVADTLARLLAPRRP